MKVIATPTTSKKDIRRALRKAPSNIKLIPAGPVRPTIPAPIVKY